MLRTTLFTILALLVAVPAPANKKFDPAEGWRKLFNGKDLSGWKQNDPKRPHDWSAAAKAVMDPNDSAKIVLTPLAKGSGEGLLVNGPAGDSSNIFTEEMLGDVELYLEFMIPKDSNSGIYLQGLYEIQIRDSYGKKDEELGDHDCGAIYGRWINEQTVDGKAPPVNASRGPGEWQSFHIWFRAPRFDAQGKKTENARFVKVIHNGITLHQDFELKGPTRAHMDLPESARGPLMLQGDHGPVAYRNLYVRALN